jgi:hypothetical protein
VIIIIHVDFECEIEVEDGVSIMLFESKSWLLLPPLGINHFFCIINDLAVALDIALWFYRNTHYLQDTLKSITLLGPNTEIITIFHQNIGGDSWTLETSAEYAYGNSEDKGHQLFVFNRKKRKANIINTAVINEAVRKMESKYSEKSSLWYALYSFGVNGGVHATPMEIIKWLFTTINLQEG